MKSPYTLEKCLDILEFFGAADFDYLAHILTSKTDAEARIARALPDLRKRAKWLVKVHAGTECAYPWP